MKAEVAAAEARGKSEAEKAALQSGLEASAAQAEAQQASMQRSIQRLESDAKDYKVLASEIYALQSRGSLQDQETNFASFYMPGGLPVLLRNWYSL